MYILYYIYIYIIYIYITGAAPRREGSCSPGTGAAPQLAGSCSPGEGTDDLHTVQCQNWGGSSKAAFSVAPIPCAFPFPFAFCFGDIVRWGTTTNRGGAVVCAGRAPNTCALKASRFLCGLL